MMKATEAQAIEYLKRSYSRMLVPEPDGGFSATVLEWPGCYGEGETAEEAMASLEESMVAWVAVMLEDGRPIPEPVAREYSGKMMLRLSRELHRRVVIRAEAEGVSANHFIVGAIEARLAEGQSSESGSRTITWVPPSLQREFTYRPLPETAATGFSTYRAPSGGRGLMGAMRGGDLAKESRIPTRKEAAARG